MTAKLSTAVRNAGLDAITTAIGAAGTIKFYAGTQPSTGGSVSGNTLLGTLTCANPSAPSASGGVLTFSTITQDSSADATGTATFARIASSSGTFVGDFTVGVSGSGADIIVNSTSFTSGLPISISSFVITAGNA